MEQLPDLFSFLPKSVSQTDAEHALKVLADYKREGELTRRDKAKAQALKEMALEEITRKYDLYEKLFAAIFAERTAITKKFFSIINKGIKEKNNELVLSGLSNLSQMVTTSPLTNLEALKQSS
jgi:hypothetical protein